jgi:hypothetical protein
MRAYVLTTGVVFGLIVLAHAVRAYTHGAGTLTEPWFVATTAAAVALCCWAAYLLRPAARP